MGYKKLYNQKIAKNDKTFVKGGFFSLELNSEFSTYLENIENIFDGKVEDPVTDGKIVGKVLCNQVMGQELRDMHVLLNYRNTKEIIEKHGNLDIDGLIMTINFADKVILSQGRNKNSVLNFIKFSKQGFQIAAAIRINGFAVITHFERLLGDHHTTRRTQHHLDSVLNRGSVIYSSGKTADLPLIVDENQHPPSEP